ncbi:hypothetical protein, partial [Streptomyces yanii]|uniref:hypothetical protein n=1 Tax=Streptomyces yanii TaxID=78510 RepID=UPI0031F19A1F
MIDIASGASCCGEIVAQGKRMTFLQVSALANRRYLSASKEIAYPCEHTTRRPNGLTLSRASGNNLKDV